LSEVVEGLVELVATLWRCSQCCQSVVIVIVIVVVVVVVVVSANYGGLNA